VYVIFQRYGKDKTTTEAMTKYLTMVSQFPLYGCTKIFAHYLGTWPYGVETVLAVNYDGIKIVSLQEKKMVAELCYAEIDRVSIHSQICLIVADCIMQRDKLDVRQISCPDYVSFWSGLRNYLVQTR